MIDYSELKATECTWANVNKTMPKEAGHDIPQSNCFTEYENQNQFILNYLESIF